MKIEEYRFRWGYEKSVQSGILKLKTSRIFYKNCKTFVFLPSLDTPKKNWGVPCPIACNRIWCTMSNAWHDLRLWANAVVGEVTSLSFSMHIPRDIPLSHVSIVKRGRAECCCDLGECNAVVTVQGETFNTRTTITQRAVIGWYRVRQSLNREQVSPKTKSRNDGTSLKHFKNCISGSRWQEHFKEVLLVFGETCSRWSNCRSWYQPKFLVLQSQ